MNKTNYAEAVSNGIVTTLKNYALVCMHEYKPRVSSEEYKNDIDRYNKCIVELHHKSDEVLKFEFIEYLNNRIEQFTRFVNRDNSKLSNLHHMLSEVESYKINNNSYKRIMQFMINDIKAEIANVYLVKERKGKLNEYKARLEHLNIHSEKVLWENFYKKQIVKYTKLYDNALKEERKYDKLLNNFIPTLKD